jgi:hypothetical protein
MVMLKSALVVNAVVNGVMLGIVSLYFMMIINKIKVRSNSESKCRFFWVGVACFLRFALSLYDCFLDPDRI